ncbi:MAG: hypothetical protein JW839_17610 [Candidatus Lokiarchaeota archaeon]|nr:hypothetical protein [Candidatus Lokiarchaeota archaeon]
MKHSMRYVPLCALAVAILLMVIPMAPVRGAGDYLIDVGEEWTITYNGTKESFKVTYISGSTIQADHCDGGVTATGFSLNSYYIKTSSLTAGYESTCDVKGYRNYGGISCYCYITYSGSDELVIDSDTGIVLERDDSYGEYILVSWNWDCSTSPGGVGGYDTLAVLGIIALSVAAIACPVLKRRARS